MNELLNSPIRHHCQDPLKEVFSTLNKLNSDLGDNQKASLKEDAGKISMVLSKDNIIGKVFKDRGKFVPKIDKSIAAKEGAATLIPIFVNAKGGHGISVEETTFNNETVYSYDIKSLEFTSLQGQFAGIPHNDQLKTALTRITTLENDYNKLRTEINSLNNYNKSFIESFNKFTKNKFLESNPDNKEVSKVVKIIVSYAKTICAKYTVLDYNNYLKTAKTINNMCDKIIKVMD